MLRANLPCPTYTNQFERNATNMATKTTKQTTDTSETDVSKKMAGSAEFNANELQKVKIYSVQRQGYTFYEFVILNQRVSLDKGLIDYLKETKAFKETLQLEPYMQLYAVQNGKYCNLRLGLTKEKRDELNAANSEGDTSNDLPF